jgi:taurine--2-oxoglutarate transaminase
LDNGVYTFIHWNVILVNPPLIINEEQLAEGIQVLGEALKITDQAVVA